MSTIVTALFSTRADAEGATAALLNSGFLGSQVSVLMTDATRGREQFTLVEGDKSAEGAAIGVATGGTVGAVLAGLAAVGSIVIPGLAIVAVGPLVAALAGAGAGGAAGGLVGALVGAGVPEHEAKVVGPGMERGGILVGVHADNAQQAEIARNTLASRGGRSVSSVASDVTRP